MNTPILTGIREIINNYDGLIIDLWGVIHDGITSYVGAKEALEELKLRGKRIVLLSNAPRRARNLVKFMTELGIDRCLYKEIITSGESVYLELLTRRDPWFASIGRRCFYVGIDSDKNLIEGLDIDLVENVEQAQFILVTGPSEFNNRIEDSAPLLDIAAKHFLPLVCANPDHIVISGGRSFICAGALASYYEKIGGIVRYRGKPDPAIYDVCLERLMISDRSRVLAVGDSFSTDVAGAHASGLDCLFCSGGIHAEEIGFTCNEMPNVNKIESTIMAHGNLRPTAVISNFIW
ncbi:MAG: TIGR01459 family HAD-type hydrolase [Rhodospirillaceae bacterium]|jgi:HAD superfamily hydrolase (TIGR01459 family)|nr:TIGR01459 family HAD-type hydrolase [Rhodospirillaceae bacterium]